MENVYDPMVVALGHDILFGSKITRDEIIKIISQYPAAQWLDICAKIEGFLLINKREGVPDPQIYLSQKFFPPSTLGRISRHSNEYEKIICFDLGQINLLRKLAIAYGKCICEPEVPIPLVSISKVLLGAQDFHNEYDKTAYDPEDPDSFFRFAIRNGYLYSNFDPVNLFVRAYQMYVVQAQKLTFYPTENFADFFKKNAGISIEEAMALSFALANPFFREEEMLIGQTTIIDPKTFFQNLIIDSKIVDSMMEGLVIDFADVKKEVLKELPAVDLGTAPLGYNIDIFSKTPIIKLENGKLVCANLSFLIQKTTQNLIWLPKSRMTLSDSERKKLVIDLTSYRGRLFEEYVKYLCGVLVNKNPKMSFCYIPPESTLDHEEVGDSILIQDQTILILEAKSRQFNESFKYTGDWAKDKQFIEELVKKATNQIEIAAQKIKDGKVDKFPLKPQDIKLIHPVIITYEPIPMHGKIQRFIRQKVQEFGYLTDPIFAPLEIIDINDLEKIMDSGDRHTLIDLLYEKNSGGTHASETNFNNFFAYFLRSHIVLSNGWNKEQWDKFDEDVFTPAFKFK